MISNHQGKVEIRIVTHILKGSRKINYTFGEISIQSGKKFFKNLVLKGIRLMYLEDLLIMPNKGNVR